MSVAAGFRPCGQCAAYVSAELGCTHWRPYLGRRRSEGAPLSVAERNRRYAENARIRAAQAVAEFRRMMNRGVAG